MSCVFGCANRVEGASMVPIITMPRLMAVGGGALAELPGHAAAARVGKAAHRNRPFPGALRASRSGDRDPRPGRHSVAGVFRHRGGPDDGGRRSGHPPARRRRLRQSRRDRRRQLDRYREGDVGAGREWRADAGLQGSGGNPEGGSAGRGDPDDGRHRLGGDALYRHHRHRDRREDADRRASPAARSRRSSITS